MKSIDKKNIKEKSSRKIIFNKKNYETDILDRQIIETNEKFIGPIVIEEETATTVIPPNYSLIKDDSLNKLNIKHLDFLKIDTQGSELEILKGLGEYRPLMIKVEVQVVPMYEDVPNWSELVNYLYKINYMTCEWVEIGPHLTRSPVEMDMIFIPNYLNDLGKKLILSREKAFASLMLIFGHIKLLQIISEKLNFSTNLELQKTKDKFFH